MESLEKLVLRMPGHEVMHNVANMDIGFQWVNLHIIFPVLFSSLNNKVFYISFYCYIMA